MKSRKSRGPEQPQLWLIEPEPTPEVPAAAPKQPTRPEPPTIAEWRSLYAAAARFKEAGCWDWMYDSDTFGVKDPESGVVGYCSIMGKLGRHFALAVYLGSKGLAGYVRILKGARPRTTAELFELQECLMASFEDRELLAPQDRKVIRGLGLKFRGPAAWPLFRRYRRGYYPWFMSGPEVRALTTALGQALDVTLRVRTDPDLLRPGAGDTYLVRVPSGEAGSLIWHDERLKPAALTLEELAAEEGAVPLPAGYVEKLRRSTADRRGIWEFDISHFPEPIQGEPETQPFYPRQLIVAEATTGLILGTVFGDPAHWVEEFHDEFTRMVKDYDWLPVKILVRNDVSEAFIRPVCRALGIPLERGRLKAVERLHREMKKTLPFKLG